MILNHEEHEETRRLKARQERWIRGHLLKMIRECELEIRTIESWNTNRTDVPPMDCEPERVMLQIARQCLAAFDAGDGPESERLAGLLLEVAVRTCDEDNAGIVNGNS
jgi:hypothetical protein